MDRTKLLAAEIELSTYLKMAERWHPRYTNDPRLFRRLVRSEARIEQSMREYFRGLGERVVNLVNWNEVYRRQMMAEDVIVTITGTGWETEEDLLIGILSPNIFDAAQVGALMAEIETGVSVGASAGNTALLKAVRTRSLDLAKGLNKTTRDQMRQALLQGLDAGETQQQIVERLAGLVDSPARAEMIAQTESVRAASMGKLAIAGDIGTKFKVWEDGQAGECPICLSVSPKRIPVQQLFSIGVDGPPGHPRCRCGLSLDFATAEEAAALEAGTWTPED